MPRPINKTQLLLACQQGYDALENTIASLTPDEITSAEPGEWSVKDILAHLHEWQQMLFRWYEAGVHGETPAVPADGFKWNQLPALNQKIYEQYRHQPLNQVLAQWRSSHQQTISLIESLSHEDLITPGLYPWMNENTLIAYLAANGSSHYEWARKNIRAHLRKMEKK